jgi:hypothetical protein
MRRLPLFFILSVFLFSFAWSTAYADDGPRSDNAEMSPELQDSLMSGKYAEPTLQHILDSLGYDIDVVNDRLPTQVWVRLAGQYSEVMLAEVAEYSDQTASGWYPKGNPADTHMVFGGSNSPPDSAFFYITGCDSNGLFIAPFAGEKCRYVYYTEKRLNPDCKDHAWVYCSGKRPNEFVVAWEDLYNLGDQDFQDLVLLYRMPNRPPVLSVPKDTSFFRCQPESICFSNISAYDPDYCGDTAAITKIQGPGTYSAGRCCFLPATVDSTYRFIFVATDWFGAADTDTVLITVDITKPVLSCSGDELTCDSLLASATVTSNPSVGVSYLWTPAPVSGQGTAHARYDTPGTKKVVVTIAQTNCKDSCEAVITQNVTKPVLSCSGDELTCDSLLASATVTSNPSVGVSYLWTPAPISGQGTAHARYDTPGTKKVVVTIAQTNCKDSCEAVITQNITKPVLSCSGDELTCDSLLASATVTSNPSVGVSYLWTPAPISGQGTAHARYDTPGTKKVVVTITATGCKDSCEAIITQNITKPVLSCSGDELTCDSTLASATVTSNPSVGVSYLWTPAPVSGQGTAHARYDTPGTKKVVVTITQTGCKDSCEAIITQNITKPVLSCSGDELTCDSTLASADVTSNPSVGVSYLWTPAPISGQGTAHARYDAPGTKKVVVTIVQTGCKDSCNAEITQNLLPPYITCPDSMVVHSGHFSSGNFTVNHFQSDSIAQIQAWVIPAGTGITNLTVSGGTGRTPTTGHVEFDAHCNYPGIYKIWLKAIDKCGIKDSCSFQVRIYNGPPQLTCPDNGMVYAGQTFVSTDFSVTDPDGDPAPVTFLSITPPATNDPTIVGSHVEWITTLNEKEGDYTICLVATDPCGLADTCCFTVAVVYEPTGNFECPEDDSILAGLHFVSTGCSISGPKITLDSLKIISVTPTPTHMPIKVDNHVEWQTECEDAGKLFTICLEATDNFGRKDTCCFQVMVYNGPPQITCPPNGEVNAGQTFISYNFVASDPDGDLLSVYILDIYPTPHQDAPIIVGSHIEWATSLLDEGCYHVRLVASDQCGADTCEFLIFVFNCHNPNFILSVSPDTQYVNGGYEVGYLVKLTSIYGFHQSCGLTVSGLPNPSFTGVFDRTVFVPTDSTTLHIYASSKPHSGWYPLTITGRTTPGGELDIENSTTVMLSVEEASDAEDWADNPNAPQTFTLFQNQPNPFNPETKISYFLPKACQVRLTIYNLLGQYVRTLFDGHQEAGIQTLIWDGRDNEGVSLSSGIYFYRLQADNFIQTNKMTLLK